MDKVSIEEAKELLEQDVFNAMVRFYKRTGIDDIHVWGDTEDGKPIGFHIRRASDHPQITVQSKIILK